MRIGNNLQKYLLIGIVMLGFAIVGVVSVLLMNVALADSDEEVTPANGERLISLHDRGVERNILTKAHTVREALEAAEVEIAEGQDVVEPGLDEELVPLEVVSVVLPDVMRVLSSKRSSLAAG